MPIGRDRVRANGTSSEKNLQPAGPQGGLVRREVNLIINDDILRRDTVKLISQINAQIDEVSRQAKEMGIAPYELRDGNGSWVLTPLLLAKAQAYGTLVLLQANNKRG